MEQTQLTQIQLEILKALEALGEKATYSEFILAKKVRELAKIEGNKKAGIALYDLEAAIGYLEENNLAHYALHLNSANDLLIQKKEESCPLSAEARKRRQSSEKSMAIFTNSDLSAPKGKSKKPQKRTVRKSMNIYGNYDSED